MGESNEARSRAIQNFSLQIEKYPRDLLQRFMSSTGQESEYSNPNQDSEEIEIELNLGLSLGGRFGIDKNAKKKLIRSSSVINPPPASYSNIVRTSSLPLETEEEWRKRKELQMLRRMEAKRRRSEKQRNSNANLKVLEEERREIGLNSTAAASPLVVASWAVLGRVNSQDSVESQGGWSSGMLELESKAVQGSSSCGEARSPASNQSLQERSNQEAVGSSTTKACENACRTSRDQEMENPSKKPDSAPQKGKEIGANALEDMPGVFTKGDGPNGRRIEGILYKYGKGKDVRIMCVCHGSFLSPAEFVKHAGGSDVANPLKHIVVNPSSTSFL